MNIYLLHSGLIIEVAPLSGTLIASLCETENQKPRGGIEMKEAMGSDGAPPDITLDFTEVLSDFKRRGKSELQLKIRLQASETGGPYAFLLRYEGGQQSETGKVKPGQTKEWEFKLLL